MKIDGVEVTMKGVELTEAEIKAQIDYVAEKKGKKPTALTISPKGDNELALVWEIQGERFERIRRITGKPTK